MSAAVPGEVVRVKSGGPKMTVQSLAKAADGSTQVTCVWMDDKQRQQQGVFDETVLVVIKPDTFQRTF